MKKEINNIEVFNEVLEDDETIVEVAKPNKAKLVVGMALGMLMFVVFALGWIFAFFYNLLDNSLATILLISGIVFLLFITILIIYLHYKKYFFCYTNKRIIIRTGIFGVDYKSLDLEGIEAIDVYVSLLDKIVGQKTGSIIFGSKASPILGTGSGASGGYKISHMKNPYEFSKQIKQHINAVKQKISKK